MSTTSPSGDDGTNALALLSGEGLWGAPVWELVVKRFVDFWGALVLLLALSPLLLVVAMTVATTSRGPVFYVQDRVGRHRRPFRMLKFRSMYADADDRLAELKAHSVADSPVFKMKNDPRVTPIGRFLRRMSLDELPQLWNVLMGHMSLVGPRPPLPAEVATYSVREHLRLTVTPGLTCFWQVSGRSDIDFETWVSLDLEYIRTWTPWLDIRLLLRTIPAVLSGRGAY